MPGNCQLLLVIIFCTYGCLGQQQSNKKSGETEIARITNALSTKLLEAMMGERENVVVSPMGVAANLVMVMEGLDTRPASEIANVLGISTEPLARRRLRQGFRSLLLEFEKRQNDGEVAGTFVNAIVRSPLPLLPAYKNLLAYYYRANITSARLPLNSTEHRLEISSDSGVLSHWKDYDKQVEYTYVKHQDTAPFTNQLGDIVSAPMIPLVGVFRAGYIPKLDSLAVQLPLQVETVNLFVVVPDARDAVPEIVSRLTEESIPALAEALPRTHAEVSLPQSAVAVLGADLRPALSKLGISFTASARGKSRVSISSFTHSAYFGLSFVGVRIVTSEGTAIAKSVGGRRTREVNTRIMLNRPFIFFVLHKRTGLILLSGILTNPTQIP